MFGAKSHSLTKLELQCFLTQNGFCNLISEAGFMSCRSVNVF